MGGYDNVVFGELLYKDMMIMNILMSYMKTSYIIIP